MTVPLTPTLARRGPRETLLALTEIYLRCGELDGDGRHCVAVLAGRAQGHEGAWAPGGVGAPSPEWVPLAATLATMLKGEAERALQLVIDALSSDATPGALRQALLGLGVRAALATDRPALARRWRSRLWARGDEAAGRSPAQTCTAAERAPAGASDVDRAVLASLPELVREVLDPALDGGTGGDAGSTGIAASAIADTPLPDTGDGDAPLGAGEGADDGAHSGPSRGGGGPGSDRPATAVLHVVMDAYHGDVVSVPVKVEIIAATPELEGAGSSATPFGDDWESDGLPVLTVRVAATKPLPEPPEARAWHVRFVGRARALDARSSDGSLLALSWDDDGFVAAFHPPDWLDELEAGPVVLATRVTHVVVVPESTGAVRPGD